MAGTRLSIRIFCGQPKLKSTPRYWRGKRGFLPFSDKGTVFPHVRNHILCRHRTHSVVVCWIPRLTNTPHNSVMKCGNTAAQYVFVAENKIGRASCRERV